MSPQDSGQTASGLPTRVVDAAASIWLLAVTMLALTVWPDYGVTWDEQWHMEYGDRILEWFASGTRDRSALSYRRDFYYGGGYDLLGAIVRRLSGHPDTDVMHRLGAVIGVLGLLGTWRLGRELGGSVLGLLGLVFLTLTGVWWGHMFNNPKDLPFAVGYVWGLVALVRWQRHWPRPTMASWVALAVALGAAASVRIGGVVLWILFVGACAASVVAQQRREPSWVATERLTRALAVRAGATLAVAWVVMLMAWPWALQDPLRRPAMALLKMSRFDLHERTMLFDGQPLRTTEPRWDYLLHYFGFKLPDFVVVLVVVGILLGLWAAWADRDRWSDPRRWGWPLVAAATALPPLYAMLRGSVLYDGLRHFLFIVPPLCVVAAWAAIELVQRLRPKYAVLAGGLAVGTALLAARTGWELIRLHPHQYVYFNRFVGGLAGAAERYDTDYYGNTYREAFASAFDTLWDTERDVYLRSVYVVQACMPRRVAELYLPPSARLRRRGRTDDPPDLYIAYTREGCADKFRNAPLLTSVQRLGATLNVVRDLRPLYPAKTRRSR
jgi:hypothetical protein